MCGIVGLMNKERNAASDLYVALLQMQHRGKESAGMAVNTNGYLVIEKDLGEVPQVFAENVLSAIGGQFGIGQVRYSTAGSKNKKDYANIPPVKGNFKGFDFYVVHNGNIVNLLELRAITHTSPIFSDTHIIADLISLSKAGTFEEAIKETALKLQGSYNLIFIFNEMIYALRDPHGFHPLVLGSREEDFIIVSESCAIDHLKGHLLRDVEPGELLILGNSGINSYELVPKKNLKIDIFEFIYFLRPDSIFHKIEAGLVRQYLGRELAKEHFIDDADIVVSIPDSGNEATLGYYEEMLSRGALLKIRQNALFRPHSVSRTFIEPVQELREYYLSLKFNPRPAELRGKKVILIDDSIVRGNTVKRVVELVKKAGALKIYFLVSSPMYLYPDFYGIDTYRVKNELVAKNENGDIKKLKEKFGVDYLGYLSKEGMYKAMNEAIENCHSLLNIDNFYDGPFSGVYPDGTGDCEKIFEPC